jgi:hypothetical protein
MSTGLRTMSEIHQKKVHEHIVRHDSNSRFGRSVMRILVGQGSLTHRLLADACCCEVRANRRAVTHTALVIWVNEVNEREDVDRSQDVSEIHQ